MASFSPLVAILNQNKLTGSNYVDWKWNLGIFLTVEKHKYVLSRPCPNFPSLDAPLEEKQRYDRWQKSNEMAKCYILTSISNVLQHQMQDVELFSDIMLSLKEMFGEQGRSARQETIKQIYNTKIAKVLQWGSIVLGWSLIWIHWKFGCWYWWRISIGYDTPVMTKIIQGIQT